MNLNYLKPLIRPLYTQIKNWQTANYVKKNSDNTSFNYKKFATRVSNFLYSMQTDRSGVKYRYSAASTESTLYSSVYACMTYSLLGKIEALPNQKKVAWSNYFDSFQRESDGLFYDPVIECPAYRTENWWGANHLSLHIINAYESLGSKPKFPFSFLEKYYDPKFIDNWLNKYDWCGIDIGDTDVDNEIMNVGALLQYQRDKWNDKRAGEAIESLKFFLLKKINPETGFWGGFNNSSPKQRSRMIQFAYHIFPIFFFDNYFDFQNEKLVKSILKSQNTLGGYGVTLNSSACEDIDSIDLLMKLSPFVSDRKSTKICGSLKRALKWILLNQVEDGGFVFRLNEGMTYGHSEMLSLSNQGAMFPTWFRTLSVAFILRAEKSPFIINRMPGLVF